MEGREASRRAAGRAQEHWDRPRVSVLSRPRRCCRPDGQGPSAGVSGDQAKLAGRHPRLSAPWRRIAPPSLGCNTAAFSPDALSPFISKFIRDCAAAGAIGTEIPVWEQLAGEVARLFL